MADPVIDAAKPNPLMLVTGRSKINGDAFQSAGTG